MSYISHSISNAKPNIASLFLQTPPGLMPALNTVLDSWLPWLFAGLAEGLTGSIESIQVKIAAKILT